VTRHEVYDAFERARIATHLKTPVGSRGMPPRCMIQKETTIRLDWINDQLNMGPAREPAALPPNPENASPWRSKQY
jgi:hypothetical protein